MKKVTASIDIRDNGKIYFRNRQIFDMEMQDLNGEGILTVVEGRGTRTDRQNRYLWGVVYKTLAESEIGYDADEWHEICKYKFLRKHYIVNSEEMDVAVTTTKLSTKEMEEYCENIRRWGATLGINILEPNEPERVFDALDEHLGLERQS